MGVGFGPLSMSCSHLLCFVPGTATEFDTQLPTVEFATQLPAVEFATQLIYPLTESPTLNTLPPAGGK